MTIRGDNDPKFNPKKHHNQLPEDSHEFWDQCELITLCDFQVDQKGRGSAFVEPPCTFFSWGGNKNPHYSFLWLILTRMGIMGKVQ